MLNELKRYNSIGDIEGIVFFVRMLSENQSIEYKEVRNRCSLERNMVINSNGIIAFFEYLGYISFNDNIISTCDVMEELEGQSNDEITNRLTLRAIRKLIDDGVFDGQSIFFNERSGELNVKKSAFPLQYAAIRNFLIASGAFGEASTDSITFSKHYEQKLTDLLRERRRIISLEELKNQQLLQEKRGLEAEEYVLNLEKKRMPNHADRIKRISDVDVAAGYDVVSFIDEDSSEYDRFIEVKSYVGDAHFFWSENEADVARIKGDKYVLCLVDYERMHDSSYKPLFIIDPYKEVFSGQQWMVNTASYRIQKI